MKVNNGEYFIEKIVSRNGFFIGDPYYVLDRYDWDYLWNEYPSKDGKLLLGKYEFRNYEALLVAKSCDNNTIFEDNYGNKYEVESHKIGVVPLEICDEYMIDELEKKQGFVYHVPGKAFMEAENGDICINLPGGLEVEIHTHNKDEYF